jgi:hypothetical protein
MYSTAGKVEARIALEDAGWEVNADDYKAIAEALIKGQKKAATYGSRYKYEAKYLF